ncbi:MAG: L-threonylcarbamoyladenylate synthase [Hyphomicrobiaceae bacterium]
MAVSRDTLTEAARIIRAGGLVAFPTETVYGLGADATNGRAVARIYEAKGRPSFNPLIAHVADRAAAAEIGVLEGVALTLAQAFWPGPMTLVLNKTTTCTVCALATAGLDTVAVRVPSHPVARALLELTGVPVAAPSANRSGHVSATTAAHVAADLGDRVDLIVDGGACEAGIESTILDATSGELVLLRPGALTVEAIEAAIGFAPRSAATATSARARPNAPGQLESHYAPGLSVRLQASAPRPGEAFLAFGPFAPAYDGPLLNLSPTGDLVEAAANLFEALRRLDHSGANGLAVMPIPDIGIGRAINDRLRRAAAPRPSGAKTTHAAEKGADR